MTLTTSAPVSNAGTHLAVADWQRVETDGYNPTIQVNRTFEKHECKVVGHVHPVAAIYSHTLPSSG